MKQTKKQKTLNTLVTTTLTNKGTSNMSKTKPTRDFWYKAQTIGIAVNAIFKTIEVAAPHTQILDIAMVGVEQYYACVLLLWMIATNILI